MRDVLKDVFLPWYNAYRFLMQNVERLERVGSIYWAPWFIQMGCKEGLLVLTLSMPLVLRYAPSSYVNWKVWQ